METQLHVMNLSTKFELSSEDLDPVKNLPGVKPRSGGLWTSTYNPEIGSGWIDWCRDEFFSVPRDGTWKGFLIDIEPNARIYTIDKLQDLIDLTNRFGTLARYLDFESISKEYDAIRLTEQGQWQTRMTRPDLYGWDCESTLWFRWKFTDVRPIEIRFEKDSLAEERDAETCKS